MLDTVARPRWLSGTRNRSTAGEHRDLPADAREIGPGGRFDFAENFEGGRTQRFGRESPGPLTVRGDVTAHTMPIRGTVRDGPFRPGRRFAPPSSRTSQPINAAVRLPGPGFRGDGDLTDQLYAWL